MKDEELAEEYIKDNCIRWECDSLPVDDIAQEAFLAGIKAGRPQWHILAEEPDVLPKEGQKVRVLTEEGNIKNSTYFYDTYYEEFAFSNIGLLKVFAWCEIPTFDKEE